MKMRVEEIVSWLAGAPIPIGDDDRLIYIMSTINTKECGKARHGQFVCCLGYTNLTVEAEPLGSTELTVQFVMGIHESLRSTRCILLSPMIDQESADKTMIATAHKLIDMAKHVDATIQETPQLELN